jgi:ATP-dependent Clp protease ATP-binding subunit ClpB
VLDDGQLTDNRGRVANFKNTIIIMTSNMGAELILENFEDLAAVGEEHREEILATTKEEVFDALKDNLRPEFLNRIDERIMFLPLTQEEIKQIAGLLLRKTEKQLAKRGMVLKVNARAMQWLAERGYDPQFGARPMKRVLQQELVDGLSKHLIAGDFISGDTIYADLAGDRLAYSKEPFDESASYSPTGETPAKKRKRRRTKKQREAQIDELKKATDDLNDAVTQIEGE